MKMYVTVSANDWAVATPLNSLIHDASDFGVEEERLFYEAGPFNEKYQVCLTGDREKIESFISYLRMKKCKVK